MLGGDGALAAVGAAPPAVGGWAAGGATTSSSPAARLRSASSLAITRSPGHCVRLMARWGAMVAVVTCDPSGWRLEPREVKTTAASRPSGMA